MQLLCDEREHSGVFPKFLNRAELALNSVISEKSGNLINHRSMNWAQFKDSVSHMCPVSTLVAYWSLTQGVVCSSTFNDKYFFVTELAKFSENI